MSNEPSNTTVNVAESILENLIKEILLEKIMKEMIEEVAWLALPVINPIFGLAMKFAAKFFYKKAALETAFFIIQKQTDNQNENYNKEIKDLKDALDQGKSKNEIEKERREAKERLKKLINFNAG